MDNNGQIIAFIRLGDVWYTRQWLGETLARNIGFKVGNVELGGGSQILYIYPDKTLDRHLEVDGYDPDKVNAALYVLVPDSCRNWNNHRPAVPFKYVYHSQGDHNLFAGYHALMNCRGYDQSTHEAVPESIYFQICNEIKGIVGGGVPNPIAIWEMITDKSWIENAKQALVPLCQSPSNVVKFVNNINNCESPIKELLLLEDCKIYNWIRLNNKDGRLDMDELRKFLGIQ